MVNVHSKNSWCVRCKTCRRVLNTCPVPYNQDCNYAWNHINTAHSDCFQSELEWSWETGLEASATYDIDVMRDSDKLIRFTNKANHVKSVGLHKWMVAYKTTTYREEKDMILAGFELNDSTIRKRFQITSAQVQQWLHYYKTTYVELEGPRLSPEFEEKPMGKAILEWRNTVSRLLSVSRFGAQHVVSNISSGGGNGDVKKQYSCVVCTTPHNDKDWCVSCWSKCVQCQHLTRWYDPQNHCECLELKSSPYIWCDWCNLQLDHGPFCEKQNPTFVKMSILSFNTEGSQAMTLNDVGRLCRHAIRTPSCVCSYCQKSTNKMKDIPSLTELVIYLKTQTNFFCPTLMPAIFSVPHLYEKNNTRFTLPRELEVPESRHYRWCKITSLSVDGKLIRAKNLLIPNAWKLNTDLVKHLEPYVVLVFDNVERTVCAILALAKSKVINIWGDHNWYTWLNPRQELKTLYLEETTSIEAASLHYVQHFIPCAVFKAYGATVPAGWIEQNLPTQHRHSYVPPIYSNSSDKNEVQDVTDLATRKAVKLFYLTLAGDNRDKKVSRAILMMSNFLNYRTPTVPRNASEPYISVMKLIDKNYNDCLLLRKDPNHFTSLQVLRDFVQSPQVQSPSVSLNSVNLFYSGVTTKGLMMYVACKYGIFPSYSLQPQEWSALSQLCAHNILSTLVLRYYNRFALHKCLPCFICSKSKESCACILHRCLLCNVGLHSPWTCQHLIRPRRPLKRLVVHLSFTPP